MTKRGYKMTEIGEIPEEWEVIKLNKICNFIRGSEPGSKSYNSEFGRYKFIRVSDLSKQILQPVFTNENKKNLVFCKAEDILLTLDGVPGIINKNFEGAISSGIRIVKPKNSDICNEFLFYILQSRDVKHTINNHTMGSMIKHASTAINFIKIPLPPLPEQQKIAEILTTADDVIQAVNKQISMTEKLKKGLMRTLLTKGIGHTKFKMTEIGEIPEEWRVSKISDIYQVLTGTTPSTRIPKYWEGGNIEWLTPKDLRNLRAGLTIPMSGRKITKAAVAENSLDILPVGSIIMSTRAPVGYVGITTVEYTFNQGCKALLNKENTIPLFHAYYLANKTGYLNSLSSGSTFKELSKDTLEGILIVVPSLPEQQKIAEILTTVDNKIELLKVKKEKTEVLKRGLMQILLTGKVRVKIDSPEGEN